MTGGLHLRMCQCERVGTHSKWYFLKCHAGPGSAVLMTAAPQLLAGQSGSVVLLTC